MSTEILNFEPSDINRLHMTAEVQGKIQKFLYNLSTENYAAADRGMREIIRQKVDERFNNALRQVQGDKNKKN
jgi:hypothetical protein